MDIQRINRTDAEKVYFHYRNMSGSTINANNAVVMDLGTTIDGVSSVLPASASFLGWIGIADANLGDTGYGRAQAFGYRSSILLSHYGSSTTVTAGGAMLLVNGQGGLASAASNQALSTCGWRYVIAATTASVSAANYTDGIIRCL